MTTSDPSSPDLTKIAHGPSSERKIGDLTIVIKPGNPMKNDYYLGGEAHTLWIGNFPAASVFYGIYYTPSADKTKEYVYGWQHHTAHTCVPYGPFVDLEAVLDDVIRKL